MRKNNPQKFVVLIGGFVFVAAIVYLMYFLISPSKAPEVDPYQVKIDSLNRENEKLDSLYRIEMEKKNEVRIKYKTVSIQSELDSLEKLKSDIEGLKLKGPAISDTINPDSLRSLLLKEFN